MSPMKIPRMRWIIAALLFLATMINYCDRIALMHSGRVRALGSPEELKDALGPGSTLEEVFRSHTGDTLAEPSERLRSVRETRRTARRLG